MAKKNGRGQDERKENLRAYFASPQQGMKNLAGLGSSGILRYTHKVMILEELWHALVSTILPFPF
jgi:hypothetical protein